MAPEHKPNRRQQRGSAFPEILAGALRWNEEFVELAPVRASDLNIEDNALIFGENRLPLDQPARTRLLSRAGAPVGYLGERSISLQMVALCEHLRQGDLGDILTPVLREGKLFTLQSSNLLALTNSDVLAAVSEALGENAASLTIAKLDRSDGRLELDLLSPERTVEVRRGDVVNAGLHIEHSRYGGGATQIHTFVYRLVCENGMTRRECVSAEGIVRTRKLPASHSQAKVLMLDQIRRLTARTWQKLQPQLQELRSTSERRADVRQLLKQWLQRARISTRITDADSVQAPRTVMDRLLKAWRDEGAEDTTYAAVNALTHVGTHDRQLSARQRRALSLLGGLLAFSGVHLCPRCFSVITESVHARAEDTVEIAAA